jgi:Fe-S-cluster containining protein
MTRLPVLPSFPEMRCDAHCELCCSECVPVSESELVRVVLYANEHEIEPGQDPSVCPWYDRAAGRCSVYEARPIVCRAFGHLPDAAMQCDRGYNVDVDAAGRAEVIRAMSAAGRPVRFLHEVQASSQWQARVAPVVWEGVQEERRRAGLPLLGPVKETMTCHTESS